MKKGCLSLFFVIVLSCLFFNTISQRLNLSGIYVANDGSLDTLYVYPDSTYQRKVYLKDSLFVKKSFWKDYYSDQTHIQFVNFSFENGDDENFDSKDMIFRIQTSLLKSTPLLYIHPDLSYKYKKIKDIMF